MLNVSIVSLCQMVSDLTICISRNAPSEQKKLTHGGQNGFLAIALPLANSSFWHLLQKLRWGAIKGIEVGSFGWLLSSEAPLKFNQPSGKLHMQMLQDKIRKCASSGPATVTCALCAWWAERFQFGVKVCVWVGVDVCVCVCVCACSCGHKAQVQRKRAVSEDWRAAVDVQCSHP